MIRHRLPLPATPRTRAGESVRFGTFLVPEFYRRPSSSLTHLHLKSFYVCTVIYLYMQLDGYTGLYMQP